MATRLIPIARVEHEDRIIKSFQIIHPTGCTPQFCQSGRLDRPLEPHVGENRPLSVIKSEAEAFLKEMYDEGLFENQKTFNRRLEKVMEEITAGIVETKVWADQQEFVDGVANVKRVEVDGKSSRGWIQTSNELEWGVRASWRNSRKCILRAHYHDLKLVDLRDVKTSRGMIDAIIQTLPGAYNGGRIQPSVFMFPQRSVDEVGPIFWSTQLLSFAGYPLPNGEVLGDPANVQLTRDIMELRWTPPEPKSRWDVLPLVAMAEGDEPAWGDLPSEFTDLINIRHPEYLTSFAKMDLKWVRFPALSRLGFDVGGVQYTASPFIGWFMDAEIGVRNLADTFRYNVLPDVIEAIGYQEKAFDFENLPDCKRLLWMSKAQAELNYAVHYSFSQAGVSCISTLEASESWCAFDDQHFQEKGYRLNADPYWIAPPQGSIIPLWHRGAAPNYQPKPLIAKHRYDPVKVWRKSHGCPAHLLEKKNLTPLVTVVEIDLEDKKRIHVFYTGTGNTASKLAERLRKLLLARHPPVTVCHFSTLNSVSTNLFREGDIILIVASTTGEGQIPSNGLQFSKKMQKLKEKPITCLKYSVFGIGDSGYHLTFNAAANNIGKTLLDSGATPIISAGAFNSDVAMENPPFSKFQLWWKTIEQQFERLLDVEKMEQIEEDRLLQEFSMLNSYEEGTVYFNQHELHPGRVLKLVITMRSTYQEMSHIRVLCRNSSDSVDKVLFLLDVIDADTKLSFHKYESNANDRDPTVREFLTHYVDLDRPFNSLHWIKLQYPGVESFLSRNSNYSVLKVLHEVFHSGAKPPTSAFLSRILFSMPIQRPRCYSIASSPAYSKVNGSATTTSADLLIRVIPAGRFSSQCLSDIQSGDKIRYKLDSFDLTVPFLDRTEKPLVAVTCGTGFGPMRSLIQRRTQEAKSLSGSPTLKPTVAKAEAAGKITLYLGFKPQDKAIFVKTVNEASKYDIFDAVHMVPSNKEKIRVQDLFEKGKGELMNRLVDQDGWFYVCGNREMVNVVKERMRDVLGHEVWETMSGRVVEEVF